MRFIVYLKASIPNCQKMMMMKASNVAIGEFSLLNSTNENGARLIRLATGMDYIIMSTYI